MLDLNDPPPSRDDRDGQQALISLSVSCTMVTPSPDDSQIGCSPQPFTLPPNTTTSTPTQSHEEPRAGTTHHISPQSRRTHHISTTFFVFPVPNRGCHRKPGSPSTSSHYVDSDQRRPEETQVVVTCAARAQAGGDRGLALNRNRPLTFAKQSHPLSVIHGAAQPLLTRGDQTGDCMAL